MPNLLSLTTCCVCPEPGSLPSTGITRLQRYYGPLRHPTAPGSSLAGLRLVIADHAVGLPVLRTLPLCTCCRHYPGAAAGDSRRSSPQSYQPSPHWQAGRPAHRPFRGLLGVHSRYGLHTRAATVIRGSHSKGFNRFVTSTVAPVASGWSCRRVGLSPTGKRRLFTAHATLSQWRCRNACREAAAREYRFRPLPLNVKGGTRAGRVRRSGYRGPPLGRPACFTCMTSVAACRRCRHGFHHTVEAEAAWLHAHP